MKKLKIGEWSNLEIDKLPKDLFAGTGKYEIQEKNKTKEWVNSSDFINGIYGEILRHMSFNAKYRYRMTPPPRPTHKEIMTNFWEIQKDIYSKVDQYDKKNNEYKLGARIMTPYEFDGLDHGLIPTE